MKSHSRAQTSLEGSVDKFVAPTLDTNHDYEAQDYDYHYRRSVLSKVKDKAMIWKRITRRNSYNDASTPEWGVSLQDEFDEDDDPDQFPTRPRHGAEEQSETTQISRPKWRSIPEIYQRHVLKERAMKSSNVQKGEDEEEEEPMKALTRTVTRTITAPAYAVASGAQMIASMLQDVVVSGTSVASASIHQIIDKGSSGSKGDGVVQKGEEETRKNAALGNEESSDTATGVREKVREAVSSIIQNELGPSSRVSTTMDSHQDDEDHQSQRVLQTN